MTLEEIRDKKLGAVINAKTKNEALLLVKILGVDKNRLYDETDFINVWDAFKENTCYRVIDGKVDMSDCVKYYQSIHEKIYKFSDLFATGGVVSIHDLPTSEWYNPIRLTFKNGSSIEALPNTSDVIRSTSDFCTGFKGGNTPTSLKMEVVKDRTKTAKDWIDSLTDAWTKLGCTTFRVSPSEADELIKKEFNVKWIEEEKKMPTKFTFYVTEGTRVDKSCNGTIPTMTTNIELLSGNAFDGVTTVKGSATCDKADYDERQGVLEALANAICGGNFYKAYAEAVKLNRCNNELSRTCIYCGKVLDTAEEKQEHEAWHVECRKARHERYLLRKRAKEIAFEEQAQKMAKEIIVNEGRKKT